MTTAEKDSLAKFWPPLVYPLSLSDALNRLTKQELTMVRTKLGVSNLSTLNKQALADKLAEQLPEHIWGTLRNWDQNRLKLIRKIVSSQGRWDQPRLEVQQYFYFRDRGLLFPGTVDGKRMLLMPAELLEWFKAADLSSSQETINRNSEIIQLTRGLLFYYGSLTESELEQHLLLHTNKKIEGADLIEVLFEAMDYYEEIELDANGAFHDYRVVDPEAIRKERALRSDLDYCAFTKAQLLKAGETQFVEKTKQFTDLVHFMLSHYDMEREEAELLADEVADAARNGVSLGVVIELVQEFVDIPDLAMMQSLMERLVPLMNNTKQWALKGYSPSELSAVRKEGSVGPVAMPARAGLADVISIETKKKVGRNDPCPCGSGKKFKKCCGA